MNDLAENMKSSSAKIIPFPMGNTSSSSELDPDFIMSNALSNPQVRERLKSLMEAAVLDVWVKTRFFDSQRAEDPFDAIYICDLRPDAISRRDVDQIVQYHGVLDISETIQFDDGWDD